jgi:hypothetical protein
MAKFQGKSQTGGQQRVQLITSSRLCQAFFKQKFNMAFPVQILAPRRCGLERQR